MRATMPPTECPTRMTRGLALAAAAAAAAPVVPVLRLDSVAAVAAAAAYSSSIALIASFTKRACVRMLPACKADSASWKSTAKY